MKAGLTDLAALMAEGVVPGARPKGADYGYARLEDTMIDAAHTALAG
ncbi:MAG: hypothetical protein P3W90_001120 [Paracoccus sp. (in: a-proteobacteria)]|nr:hypothetical protein [Paracoccus sp. (in: a-proteobacteria)]